jgi:hypothetical protein
VILTPLPIETDGAGRLDDDDDGDAIVVVVVTDVDIVFDSIVVNAVVDGVEEEEAADEIEAAVELGEVALLSDLSSPLPFGLHQIKPSLDMYIRKGREGIANYMIYKELGHIFSFPRQNGHLESYAGKPSQ